MEQFGDLFPGDPADLDELLEQLAQRMAAASAMLASMTPGERAQLQELMDELLSDMDLSWQINRLAGNLRAAFPGEQWDRRMSFSGRRGHGPGRDDGHVPTPGRARPARNHAVGSPAAGRAGRGRPRSGPEPPGQGGGGLLGRAAADCRGGSRRPASSSSGRVASS